MSKIVRNSRNLQNGMYLGHCNREDYSGCLLLFKKTSLRICGVRRHVIISHTSDWRLSWLLTWGLRRLQRISEEAEVN